MKNRACDKILQEINKIEWKIGGGGEEEQLLLTKILASHVGRPSHPGTPSDDLWLCFLWWAWWKLGHQRTDLFLQNIQQLNMHKDGPLIGPVNEMMLRNYLKFRRRFKSKERCQNKLLPTIMSTKLHSSFELSVWCMQHLCVSPFGSSKSQKRCYLANICPCYPVNVCPLLPWKYTPCPASFWIVSEHWAY